MKKRTIVVTCLIAAICLFQFVSTGAINASEKNSVIIATAENEVKAEDATAPSDEEGAFEGGSETEPADDGTVYDDEAGDDNEAGDDEEPADDEETPKSE